MQLHAGKHEHAGKSYFTTFWEVIIIFKSLIAAADTDTDTDTASSSVAVAVDANANANANAITITITITIANVITNATVKY